MMADRDTQPERIRVSCGSARGSRPGGEGTRGILPYLEHLRWEEAERMQAKRLPQGDATRNWWPPPWLCAPGCCGDDGVTCDNRCGWSCCLLQQLRVGLSSRCGREGRTEVLMVKGAACLSSW